MTYIEIRKKYDECVAEKTTFRSRDLGEVFTPEHIVDQMLNSIPNLNPGQKILDLCAGFGQFTIGVLKKFNEIEGFDCEKYLFENHFFCEMDPENCEKIIYIFGDKINLAMGNCLNLAKLGDNWHGLCNV